MKTRKTEGSTSAAGVLMSRRRRLFEIIEVGAGDDRVSRLYDFVNVLAIVVNLIVSILFTFEDVRSSAGAVLTAVEIITVVFFALDYVFRLFTAKYLRPEKSEAAALVSYIFSFSGIVDLLCFLPYFLPFVFPSGTIAFRMFRIVRIFRLFRINAYYDSLNVITEVIISKGQQLLSSVFIILVLMLASSLAMYSLEHEAQPEVFKNAFSGIWWSVSTLLTVGYGDIYPVTTLGKIFSIIITFLGVGMVAIPTGIISAGFVDQYAQMKRKSDYLAETDVRFIRTKLTARDPWVGLTIRDLKIPKGILVAAVRRGRETIVPRGDVIFLAGDLVILAAEPYMDGEDIDLREIVLSAHNPWVGQKIRDLDISRQTMIVCVKRKGQILDPNGELVFREADTVYLYTNTRVAGAVKVEV